MTPLQDMIESAKEIGIEKCYIVVTYELREKSNDAYLDCAEEEIMELDEIKSLPLL